VSGLPNRHQLAAWRGGPPTTCKREGLACLGGGNKPSMVVLTNGKRRGPGAEPLVRVFGNARTCAADGCSTRLCRYNPARCCTTHQGWDQQQVTRPRRRR
jgi:hypothetical protein